MDGRDGVVSCYAGNGCVFWFRGGFGWGGGAATAGARVWVVGGHGRWVGGEGEGLVVVGRGLVLMVGRLLGGYGEIMEEEEEGWRGGKRGQVGNWGGSGCHMLELRRGSLMGSLRKGVM